MTSTSPEKSSARRIPRAARVLAPAAAVLLPTAWLGVLAAPAAADELPCRVYDTPDVGTAPPYVYDPHTEVGCFRDDPES